MANQARKGQGSIQIWGVAELVPQVKALAEQEQRTVSKMAAILLQEALQARKSLAQRKT